MEYQFVIANTLQPGLLVSLKTSIRGNVEYRKVDLETDHTTEDGSRRAKWETTRTIDDPTEHQRAVEIRGRCRTLITRHCTSGNFMLCPQRNEAQLEAAIIESQQLAAEFNSAAKLTRIEIYPIVGRIEQDDVKTVRGVRSELRELISDMETGIRNLNSDVIRKAANELKATKLTQMLSTDAAKRVEDTITVARATAKQIIKASESAAAEVDEAALRFLKQSQSMFLDLDDSTVPAESQTSSGVAIELELPLFKPKQKSTSLASQIEL